MTPKTKIYTDEQLRSAMKNGVDTLANIVKVTLGAKGRNVSLPRPYGSHITKDGVSVAREVFLEDPLENMWAQKLKEVASQTNRLAGDGTTTATVLAQAIIKEGLKNVTAGANPMELKEGIDLATDKVVAFLEENTRKINMNSDELKEIATISANGDKHLGKVIAETFSKVGAEGLIEVKRSNHHQTYVEFGEGMEVASGYVSPFFITDFTKMQAVFDNPLIYISDRSIKKIEHIKDVIDLSMQNKRPLIFICHEIEGEALQVLIANAAPQNEKRFPFAVIKAPSWGNEMKEILEDIATITGGNVISETKGTAFKGVSLDDLGKCERIVISEKQTNIIKGNGEKKSIENRINILRKQIDQQHENEQDKRKLQNRLAKMQGCIATLYVGYKTDTQANEEKDRIEDAINATRASLEEGIIAGGGVALLQAQTFLSKENFDALPPDVKLGTHILMRALEAPIAQIVQNAGKKPDVIIEKIKSSDPNLGYDVKTEQYVDMFQSGIIDPKKVTRVALQNASSVAGLMLTTEGALITID